MKGWTLALLLTAIIVMSGVMTAILVQSLVLQPENQLRAFTSQKELENFIAQGLNRTRLIGPYYYANGLRTFDFANQGPLSKGAEGKNAAGTAYSTTNIQVSGVDEADIVKTDGKFIYIASKNSFTIIEVYPPKEMKAISATQVKGSILGLFVNGDRLVILEEGESPIIEPSPEPLPKIVPHPSPSGVHVKIYDLSKKTSPSLARDIFLSGVYLNSRMIGDWVYAVASQPAIYWIQERPEVLLPTVCVDGKVKEIPATRIHYSNSSDIPVSYTLIVALNVQEKGTEPEFKVVLTGYTTCMFVSQSSIYLTMSKGSWWREEGSTVIYRITIDRGKIDSKASGEVPGRVLNQFSMDEYKDHFRVATTGRFGRGQITSTSNVYILDMGLSVIGKLEGLAPGEQIYSARFMDGRCYLVTFKKVDPFFTIDVSNPRVPRVLGKLKIPGYSDYLHPYDENHILGIGKETVEAKEGDFAWYQGLKLSLFDVSDIENPKEVGKLVIGDRGTDSPVLRDHHAILFDKQRNLLVIPVLEAKIFPEKYPRGVPPSTYGEYIFQGVYVLNITPKDGISVEGRLTHIEDPQAYLKSGYYFYSENEIRRSLYIEDVLYTISQGKIKANNLLNLGEISAIRIAYP